MKLIFKILYYGLVFPFIIHMIYRMLTYPFRGGERKLRKELDAIKGDRALRVALFKCMFEDDYGYFMGPAWYYKQDHATYVSLETIQFLMFLYDLTAHDVCDVMSTRRFTLYDVEGIDSTLGTTFAARHPSQPRNESRIKENYHGTSDPSSKHPKTIKQLVREHIQQHGSTDDLIEFEE